MLRDCLVSNVAPKIPKMTEKDKKNSQKTAKMTLNFERSTYCINDTVSYSMIHTVP